MTVTLFLTLRAVHIRNKKLQTQSFASRLLHSTSKPNYGLTV